MRIDIFSMTIFIFNISSTKKRCLWDKSDVKFYLSVSARQTGFLDVDWLIRYPPQPLDKIFHRRDASNLCRMSCFIYREVIGFYFLRWSCMWRGTVVRFVWSWMHCCMRNTPIPRLLLQLFTQTRPLLSDWHRSRWRNTS